MIVYDYSIAERKHTLQKKYLFENIERLEEYLSMKAYKTLSKEELQVLQQKLAKAYEDAKGKGLKLDMSRGKPSATQLDTGMEILNFKTLNLEE